MSTVLDVHLHFHSGVESVEDLLGYLHTCKDALFLDQQLAFAHAVRRDAAQCGVVTIAYILAESKVNKPLVQFFYTKHNCIFYCLYFVL